MKVCICILVVAMRAPETSPRSKHKLYLAEMERDLLKNWRRSRGGMPFASEAGAAVLGDPGASR